MTTAETNIGLVRRCIDEAWNQGLVDVLDEVYDPGFRSGYGGVDEVKAAITSYRASFPDLHLTVEDTVADDTSVAYRWTARGTHLGDLDGLAPTGRPMVVTGITMVHVREGRIVRDFGESSIADLPDQLG
jgi:predicted ester cyclase